MNKRWTESPLAEAGIAPCPECGIHNAYERERRDRTGTVPQFKRCLGCNAPLRLTYFLTGRNTGQWVRTEEPDE